jgi:DNA mismatch repair ATPase MutS
MFCFKEICDIGIASAKQRPFSVRIGSRDSSKHNSKHALLTGPNRGGKSTALRAVLRNLILAHCFGVGIGSYIELTPFDWIQSCLRLEDLPGRASLFEREVAFAAASLSRPIGKRGAVFVDELFHSTNPPDAAAASAHYLQQLWNQPQIASIISTHVFELVEAAPAGIQRLCCPAELRADGSVDYKYGIARGICKVSSVGEIMQEQGLGTASDATK